ncbi:MAG: sensor histidine kinase [Halobacteriales archaeon]
MRVPSWARGLTPAKIAGLYAGFGLLWITLSDYVVFEVLGADEALPAIQTVKGSVFVAASAAIIYGLTSRRERQLVESRENLEHVSERLRVLQRVFRHNIRNDMNVIKGYVDTARDGVQSNAVERQLSIASDTAEDVIAIGEKLQTVDRYELTNYVDHEIDLVRVVENEVDAFARHHPRASIDVGSPTEAVVRGDRSIHEVVSELLENAARHFDDPLEQLHVEVRVTREPGRTRMRISDNGPGIPPKELIAIREGHESNLHHTSSIGLWVVHWLCERLDADIAIDSEIGDGTDVTIEFSRPATIRS